MRVLVTTSGSAGHLGPLIPFAGAVRDAGGEVLISTRDSMATQVAAAGFDVDVDFVYKHREVRELMSE